MSADADNPFEHIGYALIEILVLRGKSTARNPVEGFWVVERCDKPPIDAIHFVSKIDFPGPDYACDCVMGYNDTTQQGISRLGNTAKTLHRDCDSARYLVTARVVQHRDAKAKRQSKGSGDHDIPW